MTPEEICSDAFPIPILGFCAYSGTGKTMLLTRLIPVLMQRGLRVGLFKHTHHEFEIDRKGKDSYRFRKGGAREVLVASRERWALIHENPQVEDEPVLRELLPRMDLQNLDLILLEGLKHEAVPKIEIHRPSIGQGLMHPRVPGILAVACDGEPVHKPSVPLLNLNNVEAIADFIIGWMRAT